MSSADLKAPTLYAGLDAEFSAYLRARAVPPDVAAKRGYRMVRQGKREGGGDFAAAWDLPPKAAGMLIPLHGILDPDSKDSVQLRIAKELEPKFTNAKGKVRKFLTPQGQKNVLATHPRTRALFSQGQGGIIAEGVTRIDALAAYDIPAAAITGVWNWRNAEGLLPDLENLPIKGNRWLFVPDGDVRLKVDVFDAVRRMQGVFEKKGAESVHVVALPDGLGLDDWIAENGFQDADTLLHALYERITEVGRPTTAVEIDANILANNPHFRLLGFKRDQIAFYTSSGRLVYKSPEALCTVNTLVTLAPIRFWLHTAGTGSGSMAPGMATTYGDLLLRAAEDMGETDTTRATGRGAFKLSDGTYGYNLGDRLLVNGDEFTIRQLFDSNGKVETPDVLDERYWISEPRIELGPPASAEDMRDMAKAVMAYRWGGKDKNDGRRFLAWIVTSIVGGALEWRPHAAFVAEPEQGKSWMLKNVLEPLMHQLQATIGDATGPALARETDHSSLPIVIDEAEPTAAWILDVFALLRIASGGSGRRLRADGQSGGVNEQTPQFSALLSSTGLPRLGRAEMSRLATVRLGPEVKDWPKVKADILRATEHADAVRYRIILSVAEIAKAAAALVEEFEDLKVGSRQAAMGAALTAGWRAWGLDNKEIFPTDIGEEDDTPDAINALHAILEQAIRLDGGREPTVLQVLAERSDTDLKVVVDRRGIRLGPIKGEDGIALLPSHTGLVNSLSNTVWANHEVARVLMAIPGAKRPKNPVRFGQRQSQRGGIFIPQETLDEAGILTATLDGTDEQGEF